VFIDDFCDFLINVINKGICGIVHYYSTNKITKYEILKEIADILNKTYYHIVPDNSCVADAKRPRDTQLLDESVDATMYTQTDFRTALRMCFDKYIHPPIMGLNDYDAMNESMFLMFDLDGTLVATDQVHYCCYAKALSQYGIDLKWTDFDKYINTCVFDEVLKEKYHLMNDEICTIKAHKNNLMKDEDIFLIKGAEALIHHISSSNINTVVVTNTSREIVDLFKQKLPILNKIKQWVCREDYKQPKPNSECYNVAMNSYYKNEKYIIGFENTMNGYNAIKEVAKHVYIVTDKTRYCYSHITVHDVNIVSDFERI
jgi:beta-phosphoglucomutase-like phosphatase (HAD superfamily)